MSLKVNIDQEFSEYFHKLLELTRRLQKFEELDSYSDFICEIELALDEITPFLFYKFYILDEQNKKLKIISELCPENLSIDLKMYHWSISNNGPSFIPLITNVDKEIKANILIPIIGKKQYGVISLWVNYEISGFNLFISLALRLLSQKIAATLAVMEISKQFNEQKDFMESIIENVQNSLFAINYNNQIVNINSNAEILFSVKRNEVLGKPYHDVLPEKITSTISLLNSKAEVNNGIAETEIEYQFNEGNVLLLGLNSSIIFNESGEKIGYVITCKDLAASREMAKLLKLDAVKNEFVSLVSHELKSPLSSIISYSELLLTPGMVETEEEKEQFLNTILQEGQRLARLINDILDFSKSEIGKIDYIFEPNNINSIALQCIRSAKPLADKKKIEIKSELEASLLPVPCDRDRIVQVFLNIMSNAIKFTPENGLIIVYTRCIRNNNKDFIQVEIKDNGKGISEKDFDKVFNKFEQVKNTESPISGTGLGMPISKNIIEQGHGGRIFIESELNKGTSIFFELPL